MSDRLIYLCDLSHETSQGLASEFVPFGIGCIKSYFQKYSTCGGQYEVAPFKHPRRFSEAFEKRRPNVVAFANYCWNLDLSYTFARKIKKRHPETLVDFGVLYASLLEPLGKGRVISIDIEIRKHNSLTIQSHPMSKRITLIEGDSLEEPVVEKVRSMIRPEDKVLVTLDSNHTHGHVRQELERYGPMVTPESYVVVFDGVMEVLSDAPSGKPEWASDNPSAALRDFLADHAEFKVDAYNNRLGVTYSPNGFLRRKWIDQEPLQGRAQR